MSDVLAVCGKGGVGKTTLTALMARALAAGGHGRVLVVDADPSGGLAMALGLAAERTLDDLRRELIARVEGGAPPDPTDLVAMADYRLMETLVERGELAFLGVGRPEEEGCYCKLNVFLRESIEALSSQFALTIIDAEAGIEQINRRVMRAVSHLLLVSDVSQKGLRVAEAILDVAGTAEAGLVINRAERFEGERVAARTNLPLLGVIPEDPLVREFDMEARAFFEIPESSTGLQACTAVLEAFGIMKTE
jgi:CO dehydrogenase maturation factor